MIRPKTLALVTALVTGAALVPPTVRAQQPPSRTADSAPAATASATKISRGDRNALSDIAQANMAEIEAGKLALQKAQNANVKHFAQMMVDDHTKGLKDVQQVAQAKGVELPTEPSRAQKGEVKGLSSLDAKEFDREYMAKAGIGDHRKVQGMLQKVSKNAKDSDVKQLATQMLPVVEGHLAEAQSMARNGK